MKKTQGRDQQTNILGYCLWVSKGEVPVLVAMAWMLCVQHYRSSSISALLPIVAQPTYVACSVSMLALACLCTITTRDISGG